MEHEIYSVTDFQIVAPYTLRVWFDDGTDRTINFEPILRGRLFGPLRDLSIFCQVKIDPEFETLVWPNEVEFDPETLHNWPLYAEEFVKMVQSWELAAVEA